MKSYKGYLIDLDGTVYTGEQVIPSAKKFIKELINRNLPHVFITNNSALTTELLVERLNKMGIPTTKEHILTSSIETDKYIKQKFTNHKCFMIGDISLQQTLQTEVF